MTAAGFVFRLLLAVAFTVTLPRLAPAEFTPSGKLEIHYINVGQGGSTLIIGPNGTRILYDFGSVPGAKNIVPYLNNTLDLTPQQGLHYTFVSHRDKDHYFGYGDVVKAGYDVRVANYAPDSTKAASSTMKKNWLDPAKKLTTAGAVKEPSVGLRIALGDGAELIVVAVNGRVLGKSTPIKVKNENDRSISLLVKYGTFRYVLDGDLGAGKETCTAHDTNQVDVQTHVARALIAEGLMDPARGVDVLHIAHHGSESSTSAAYYNVMKPEVGLISVGLNQGSFLHPREDVVDKVLIGNKRASCVTAPPLQALFQTEDGLKGCSSTGCTSFTGLSIGDIKLFTDGRSDYAISGNNRVHGGKREAPQDRVWRFSLH